MSFGSPISVRKSQPTWTQAVSFISSLTLLLSDWLLLLLSLPKQLPIQIYRIPFLCLPWPAIRDNKIYTALESRPPVPTSKIFSRPGQRYIKGRIWFMGSRPLSINPVSGSSSLSKEQLLSSSQLLTKLHSLSHEILKRDPPKRVLGWCFPVMSLTSIEFPCSDTERILIGLSDATLSDVWVSWGLEEQLG